MRQIGNLDKETGAMAAGAGIGVIQVVTFKEYIDPTYGTIPYVDTIIPAPWNRWSTFGNIVIGGVVFAISSFTSWISNKSYIANKFLQIYGITTLIGGITNGIFPGTTAAARATTLRARATTARAISRQVQTTPTGIPMNKILA